MGNFEQAIRHYAHFEAPIVDLEGAGHNFLGDHWNPAIMVFAPFYRLFPGPQTLLVGQAVAIALAVVPATHQLNGQPVRQRRSRCVSDLERPASPWR